MIVYVFTSPDYDELHVKGIDTVLELIRVDMEEIAKNGEELEFTIGFKRMTEKEFESLPEWEG